jgi:hypothetical protein
VEGQGEEDRAALGAARGCDQASLRESPAAASQASRFGEGDPSPAARRAGLEATDDHFVLWYDANGGRDEKDGTAETPDLVTRHREWRGPANERLPAS